MGRSIWGTFLAGALAIVWVGTSASFGASAATAGDLRVAENDHTVTITHKRQLVVEYQFNPVPFKPYVKQLLSPAGVNVLRDAPHDHLHHHALMFAVAADGVNFWEEAPQAGKQVHRSMNGILGSAHPLASLVAFTEQLDWMSAPNQIILQEQRKIGIYNEKDASLLTWRTQLTPAAGKSEVKLTGSHYFGLGMRFVESMDKGGKWIYPQEKPAAEVVRGDERLVRSDWCAYTAKADGKEVTVAMFDHPDNLRHPAYWFTMANPFAYLSATTNLWKEPLMLKSGQTLNLRYGVAVWDGTVDPQQIEKLYQRWVQLTSEQIQ
ncbi:MAG: PmoA family protein [Bacillota bacterium]